MQSDAEPRGRGLTGLRLRLRSACTRPNGTPSRLLVETYPCWWDRRIDLAHFVRIALHLQVGQVASPESTRHSSCQGLTLDKSAGAPADYADSTWCRLSRLEHVGSLAAFGP
eukprot:12879078-Alexandrium_andersonii.AAC.1